MNRCKRYGFNPIGLGSFPGGGHSSPLQYSCLKNPMDGGALWSTVHGFAKSQTQVKRFSMHKFYMKVSKRVNAECSSQGKIFLFCVYLRWWIFTKLTVVKNIYIHIYIYHIYTLVFYIYIYIYIYIYTHTHTHTYSLWTLVCPGSSS